MGDVNHLFSLGFQDITDSFDKNFSEIFSDLEELRLIGEKKRYSLCTLENGEFHYED